MPKYVNAKDASARTLNIYKEQNTNNKKEEKEEEKEDKEDKEDGEFILTDEDYETADSPMSLKLYNNLSIISGFKELNGTSYTDYVKLWKIRRFPNN